MASRCWRATGSLRTSPCAHLCQARIPLLTADPSGLSGVAHFRQLMFRWLTGLKEADTAELAEPLDSGCRAAASGSVTSCPGGRLSGDGTCAADSYDVQPKEMQSDRVVQLLGGAFCTFMKVPGESSDVQPKC